MAGQSDGSHALHCHTFTLSLSVPRHFHFSILLQLYNAHYGSWDQPLAAINCSRHFFTFLFCYNTTVPVQRSTSRRQLGPAARSNCYHVLSHHATQQEAQSSVRGHLGRPGHLRLRPVPSRDQGNDGARHGLLRQRRRGR